MKNPPLAVYTMLGLLVVTAPVLAQHDHMKDMDMPMKSSEKAPAQTTLQPAQGASVKIISPKANQVFKGDKIPLQLKLTKGKHGDHIHAYVDGELVGMFKSEKGTLNGIKPGQHTLEVRVVTADHNTELDATDKISFTVK
jgi:hypothetical protein